MCAVGALAQQEAPWPHASWSVRQLEAMICEKGNLLNKPTNAQKVRGFAVAKEIPLQEIADTLAAIVVGRKDALLRIRALSTLRQLGDSRGDSVLSAAVDGPDSTLRCYSLYEYPWYDPYAVPRLCQSVLSVSPGSPYTETDRSSFLAGIGCLLDPSSTV